MEQEYLKQTEAILSAGSHCDLRQYARLVKSETEQTKAYPVATHKMMVADGMAEKTAYAFIMGYLNDAGIPPTESDITFLADAKAEVGETEFDQVTDEARRMMKHLRIAKNLIQTVKQSLLDSGCTDMDAEMFISGFMLNDKKGI